MSFTKKKREGVTSINIEPAINGYSIRTYGGSGDKAWAASYIADSFEELVGVLSQIEGEAD
jgi:hypothetical protein